MVEREIHIAAGIAFDAKNYDAALPLYEKIARYEQRDEYRVPAQLLVGWMYLAGCGAERDDEKAHYWLSRAARAGNRDAEFYLGQLRERQSDIHSALAHYEAASEQGFLPAYYRRSLIYDRADGWRDERRSLELLKFAAESGHIPARMKIIRLSARFRFGFLESLRNLLCFVPTFVQGFRICLKDIHDQRIRE